MIISVAVTNLNWKSAIQTIGKCFHDWQYVYSGIDPGMYEFLRVYVLSGCIGVIEYWLFGGMKESKEEMARWTETIVLEGIRKFAGVTKKGRAAKWCGKSHNSKENKKG